MAHTEDTLKSFNDNNLWVKRIERRENILKQKMESGNWQRFLNEYQGDYSELLGANTKILPLNLIYSYVRTEIPSLYVNDPHLEFTPKQETSIGAAKLKEIAVNDLWHRKKFKREIKKGIQDGKIIGHGWYKVGYQGDIKAIELQLNNREFIGKVEDDYFFYRINWRHMLFSDEAVDPPYDCTWIAQKFFVPLDEVRSNNKYKAARLQINGVSLSEGEKEDAKLNQRNKSTTSASDILYAELYEVWDKPNKKVLIISKQVGILQDRNWPYTKMSGFPFLYLQLSAVNDDPYGISDVGMGESHVLEKTKIRSAFLNHLKRGNRQIVMKTDNMDQANIDAYERGDDSALLQAADPKAFAALPYAPFQSDVFGLESRLDDDLSQIWGQSPNARSGAARTQTRTKFELERQNTGSVERRTEEVNVIQDIVEEAAEKISSLMEQYATTPYYVAITGFQPQEVAEMVNNRPSANQPGAITSEFGFTITRDDIKGPVNVRVKEGAAIPMDRQSKIKLLKDMADIYVEFKRAGASTSPFLGAISKMIVDEAGMPELNAALKAEGELLVKQAEEQKQQQAQAQAQQQKDAEEGKQLAIGQNASDLQMQAEELAIKKQKVESDAMIDVLRIMKDIQAQVSALRSKQIDSQGE